MSQVGADVIVDGRWFKDRNGRVLLLRGVNLSGNCKLPMTPTVQSHMEEAFFDDKNVSFVGRPFPIEQADMHFQRLRRWGLTFLRFLVTWEAIEHDGPGRYDEDYLQYVVTVLEIAKHHGFVCFIDPHQDVWSRFTGGSGAPGWTLELAGLDFRHFKHNDAAIVHNVWDASPNKRDFPKMVWPTNYAKYACATMFTLFFGGRTFAPHCRVDAEGRVGREGENIQDYLQRHYIGAICALARRVQHLGIVLGYDTMNEPSSGFIGIRDIRTAHERQVLRLEKYETPIQAMVLASGYSTFVTYYTRGIMTGAPTQNGLIRINESPNECAFLPGRTCIWREHGVWAPKDEATMINHPDQCVLKPDYFHLRTDGRPFEFLRDFWLPFVDSYGAALRQVHPGCAIFVDPEVNAMPPDFKNSTLSGPLVYAPHWYDGKTLFQKSFDTLVNIDVLRLTRQQTQWYRPLSFVSFGEQGIKNSFKNQIGTIRAEGLQYVGEWPIVIGETGVPFDLDGGAAYVHGDFSNQTAAMNTSLSAMEANLVNYTIWNYCPDNTNMYGDGWNGEDFSIFSHDQFPKEELAAATTEQARQAESHGLRRAWNYLSSGIASAGSSFFSRSSSHKGATPHVMASLDKGGRCLQAVIRPYAMKVAGTPTHMSFEPSNGFFEFRFLGDHPVGDNNCATEIFLPQYHYGGAQFTVLINVSDGRYEYNEDTQILKFVHTNPQIVEHYVRVLRKPIPLTAATASL